ncbi:unnamed protein product, partial [Effrenium voratum]
MGMNEIGLSASSSGQKVSFGQAYPMERDFACEMFRALEANPHYPIAAPQIYEAAADKIIVPHGHHQNLHVRPSPTSGNGPGDLEE